MANPLIERQQAVGKAVRALRTERGITQLALANAVNDRAPVNWVHTTTAKVERGERGLSFEEGAALAELFEVSLDEILGRAHGDDKRNQLALKRATRDVYVAAERLQDAAQEFRNIRVHIPNMPVHDDFPLVLQQLQSSVDLLNLVAGPSPIHEHRNG